MNLQFSIFNFQSTIDKGGVHLQPHNNHLEVYLIRHTKVAVEPGVCYGQTDVPLAASFGAEVDVLRSKLPQLNGFTVYSSPLRRCRELAEHLSSAPVQVDSRLMEMYFGAWEQQRWDDISDPQLKTWMANFVNQRCSGGESYRDVFQRAVAFWNDFSRQDDDYVLVVTHGGVIRALLVYLLDIPLENALRIGIDFGSVTKIRQLEYGPVIDYVNR